MSCLLHSSPPLFFYSSLYNPPLASTPSLSTLFYPPPSLFFPVPSFSLSLYLFPLLLPPSLSLSYFCLPKPPRLGGNRILLILGLLCRKAMRRLLFWRRNIIIGIIGFRGRPGREGVIGKMNRLRGEERRWRPLEVLDDFFRITYCMLEFLLEICQLLNYCIGSLV